MWSVLDPSVLLMVPSGLHLFWCQVFWCQNLLLEWKCWSMSAMPLDAKKSAAWRVLKSGFGECRSTFKSAMSVGGHLPLNRSKAACGWWRSSSVSGSKQAAVTGWRVPPNDA